MALLTTQVPTFAAPTVTFASAASSDTADISNGRTWIEYKNTSGAPVTVTVTSTLTVGGLAVQDPTFSVAATTGHSRTPVLDPAIYGSIVTVTPGSTSGMTVAAVSA